MNQNISLLKQLKQVSIQNQFTFFLGIIPNMFFYRKKQNKRERERERPSFLYKREKKREEDDILGVKEERKS